MSADITIPQHLRRRIVPLHIVTGFLGVGKTTAILSLLDRLGKEERVVVVVNEWGQIGLDGAIIASRHPTLAVREISGGCICCTAGAALHHTMQTILNDLIPDRIIIEPSGVAKPGEVLDCLCSPLLAERLDVRPVIGLVDPVRFLQPFMMEMPIYRDQVEAASILVANRCDRADQELITAFLKKAGELYPAKTAVYTTQFGILPLEVLAPFKIEKTKGALQVPDMMFQPHTSANTDEPYAQSGWTWPAGTVFVYRKLHHLFKSMAADLDLRVTRAKGIFHTDHGWLLMEIAAGAFHQRGIQYRLQSRCQLITLEKYRGRFRVLESDINACRRNC